MSVFSRTHLYLPAANGISLPVFLNSGAEKVKLQGGLISPLTICAALASGVAWEASGQLVHRHAKNAFDASQIWDRDLYVSFFGESGARICRRSLGEYALDTVDGGWLAYGYF